jgi:bacterioferritin
MSQTLAIIAQLNRVLRNELTAINQYFLHARMLKHMGLMPLADHEYKKSIDEMKYTDMIVERILTLGGLPNLQSLGELRIGQSASEIIECDSALRREAHADLEEALHVCESAGDSTSASMLRRIMASGSEHSEFLATQHKG